MPACQNPQQNPVRSTRASDLLAGPACSALSSPKSQPAHIEQQARQRNANLNGLLLPPPKSQPAHSKQQALQRNATLKRMAALADGKLSRMQPTCATPCTRLPSPSPAYALHWCTHAKLLRPTQQLCHKQDASSRKYPSPQPGCAAVTLTGLHVVVTAMPQRAASTCCAARSTGPGVGAAAGASGTSPSRKLSTCATASSLQVPSTCRADARQNTHLYRYGAASLQKWTLRLIGAYGNTSQHQDLFWACL